MLLEKCKLQLENSVLLIINFFCHLHFWKQEYYIFWSNAAERQAYERNKSVIFENRAPFINCKSEISNSEIDYVKGIDIVMPIYNLIEYSDNYLKTNGSWL